MAKQKISTVETAPVVTEVAPVEVAPSFKIAKWDPEWIKDETSGSQARIGITTAGTFVVQTWQPKGTRVTQPTQHTLRPDAEAWIGEWVSNQPAKVKGTRAAGTPRGPKSLHTLSNREARRFVWAFIARGLEAFAVDGLDLSEDDKVYVKVTAEQMRKSILKEQVGEPETAPSPAPASATADPNEGDIAPDESDLEQEVA